MTQRYAHLKVEHLRKVLESLDIDAVGTKLGTVKKRGHEKTRNPLNLLASPRGFEPLLPA
jgi:hypothetical protein